MTIGFIGLGTMGEPMARNLLGAGQPLIVWNRSADKSERLRALGATVAHTSAALFERAEVIMLMLIDERAIDTVLGRDCPAFKTNVSGKTVVNLGTTSPGYSLALAMDIARCGGKYVEAPVSGSRVPAEQGRLIGMLAGAPEVVDEIAALIAPLCAEIFRCGVVPNALRMKLAVNHYLIVTVTALAETVQSARAAEVDLRLLQRILDAGPMASAVSRMKLAKLVDEDYAAQASIRDVRVIARLVASQCQDAGASAPMIELCADLFARACEIDLAHEDMAAVGKALMPSPEKR